MTRLFSLLTAVLLLGSPRLSSGQSSSPPKEPATPQPISLVAFDKLRLEKRITILDVRSPSEFAAGHVPGATNINVNASDFEKQAATLDKRLPCVVHCAAGVRSARAVAKKSRMGFAEL